jgi:hypothetical protein
VFVDEITDANVAAEQPASARAAGLVVLPALKIGIQLLLLLLLCCRLLFLRELQVRMQHDGGHGSRAFHPSVWKYVLTVVITS